MPITIFVTKIRISDSISLNQNTYYNIEINGVVSLNLMDFKTSDYYIRSTHMLQGEGSDDGTTNVNQDNETDNLAGINECIYKYLVKI